MTNNVEAANFFRGSTIENCKTVEKSFYYNSVLRSYCSKGASLKPLSDNYVNESTLTARTLQLSLVSLFFVSCIPFFSCFSSNEQVQGVQSNEIFIFEHTVLSYLRICLATKQYFQEACFNLEVCSTQENDNYFLKKKLFTTTTTLFYTI